ncbi:hypothetical protein HID58_047255 [Brassica napus]|nr:hypothetical protein HID58_047255 [Brassica napus]CAF1909211.1 unnamed protein product [Brassica napus]
MDERRGPYQVRRESRMEWQSLRSPRAMVHKLMPRDTPGDFKTRRRNSNELKRLRKDTKNLPETQAESENHSTPIHKACVRDQQHPRKEKELETVVTTQTKDIVPEGDKVMMEEDQSLFTEEEMNKIAEEYENVVVDMDEEMLAEDDLLDEPMADALEKEKDHDRRNQHMQIQVPSKQNTTPNSRTDKEDENMGDV